MAKPFITYALVRDTYGRGYRVLGVVSEARCILYGRWLDNDTVTNVSERAVILRYADAEQAKAAVDRVTAAWKAGTPAVENARIAEQQARDSRDAAMRAAAQPCEHPGKHRISDHNTTWCDLCRLPISGDMTRRYGGGL